MTDEHQQRRLTTILAADVFGYSRLMAENEEYALRLLKAHRSVIDRLIARHEGRIFSTAGDSVLAEFSSAVEAVRCAISIQEELRARNTQLDEHRRMEFRIGINVGDVLVDGDNLYGDGVNIAARLESIAAPGNICISGSVFSLVRNKLSYGFEDIGPQAVKNIPERVPAYRLLPSTSATAHAGYFEGRWLATGAALIFLLVAGIAAWRFKGELLNETHSLTTPSSISSGRTATPVVNSSPTEAGKAFDGMWEFELTGGQFCQIKSMTFRRKIVDDIITNDDGKKLGSVAKDGSFQFSNPAPVNKNITVKSHGTLADVSGRGNYEAVGTPCQGTYEIRLLEKLAG